MADALEVDALVVGAGPAGSATARRLALRGVRVALLERSAFAEPRVGESLPPDIRPLLRDLGVWLAFESVAQLPSYGVGSVWGSEQLETQSFLTNPHGSGFHVDRSRFDRMLAHAARAAGASLFEETTLQRCNFERDRYDVSARSGSATLRFEARVVIDATGRRAQLSRSLGARRILFDRAVALAAHFCAAERDPSGLLVETMRDGWFYSAPLPDSPELARNSLIAIWMTDAEHCSPAAFEPALQSAPVTRDRLARARPASAVRVHCAESQRLSHPRRLRAELGPYLAVGDAALAVDPLSGSGVVRALRGAREAADIVCEVLAQPSAWREALASYDAARDEECNGYLSERASYYAAERRFDSPYWRRRGGFAGLSEDVHP